MTWGKSCRGTGPRQAWRMLCAAGICGFMLQAAPAWAGPNDTATTTGAGTAVVVTPLSLVKVRDLDFGRIAARTTAGTVTLDPDQLTCAAVTVIHAGACQPAEFAGMGSRRMMVRFQIPTTVTLTGPGANMTVTNLTLDTTPDLTYVGGNGNGLGNGNRRYQIVPASGIFTFRVGGRLNVNANQASGRYTGTFTVTVQYN